MGLFRIAYDVMKTERNVSGDPPENCMYAAHLSKLDMFVAEATQ